MKIKELRNKIQAGIICLILIGNLGIFSVQASELPGRETSDASLFTAPALDSSAQSGADTFGDGFQTSDSEPDNPSQPQPAPTDPSQMQPVPADPAQPQPAPTDPSQPQPAPTDPEQPQPAPNDPPDTEPTPPETPPETDPSGLPSDAVSISRKVIKDPITPGQEFPVVILIKNTSHGTALTNVKLQLELPQGISMNAEQITDTLDVKDIAPGQERKVKVKLIAGKLTEDVPTLVIKAKVTYDFAAGDQIKTGGSEKNILLPVSGDQGSQPEEVPSESESPAYGGGDSGSGDGGGSEKKQIDPMTPNIIISSYDYDKDLKAGQEFTLKLVLLNTSRQNAIENLVMSVEAGEALSIEDTSNTTYVERMNPQGTYTKEMNLKVLPQGQLENAKLDISFKYEYLKKEERAQGSSTEKFAVRFSQPDRFSVGDIQKEKEIYANEEATVSIPYVNKGKTAVYNMEARMETEMSSEETYKFLGNVDPGTNGTIDFFVTPLEQGKQKVKISVTYEDASGNEKTVEREAKLTALEQNVDDMGDYGLEDQAFGEEEETSKAGFLTSGILMNKTVAIPAAVVVAILVIVIVRRKKKKRLQQEEEENL